MKRPGDFKSWERQRTYATNAEIGESIGKLKADQATRLAYPSRRGPLLDSSAAISLKD